MMRTLKHGRLWATFAEPSLAPLSEAPPPPVLTTEGWRTAGFALEEAFDELWLRLPPGRDYLVGEASEDDAAPSIATAAD